MTRHALVLLAAVCASGCGPLLTPSLISVPRLAPDLVLAQSASTVSVTATMPGRGLSGRVLDRDTGAALAGIALDVTDADGAVASVETDANGAFRLPGASGLAAVAATDACHAVLDARPAVEPGRSSALVVLLAPVAC